MAKVVFRVSLPDELVPSLLQALRDWDVKHDPNHEDVVRLEQLIETDWPADKMQAILQAVSPTSQFLAVKKFDS